MHVVTPQSLDLITLHDFVLLVWLVVTGATAAATAMATAFKTAAATQRHKEVQ